MPLIQTSSVVSSIVGSVGGQHFQRSRYGLTLSNNPRRVSSTSNAAGVSRSQFSRISSLWSSGLDDAQRQSWIRYAAGIRMPRAISGPRQWTGFQHFIRTNQFRLSAGLPILRDGPASFTLADLGVLTGLWLTNLPIWELGHVSVASPGLWYFTNNSTVTISIGKAIPKTRSHYHGSYTVRQIYSGNSANVAPWAQSFITYESVQSDQKLPVRFQCMLPDGPLSNPVYAFAAFP